MPNLSTNVRNDFRAPINPVRSAWKESAFLMRGPLTDKKITKYQEAGYYSEAYRTARREIMERRKAKREMRQGNFVLGEGGRMVYSPR